MKVNMNLKKKTESRHLGDKHDGSNWIELNGK